jgi:hypothetical protein
MGFKWDLNPFQRARVFIRRKNKNIEEEKE